MRVFFVEDHLSRGGGLQRSVAELVPELSAFGVEPSIICLREDPESFDEHLRRRGIPVRVLQAVGLRERVLALRRMIRAEEPAVVHTTKPLSGVLSRLASLGLPVVVVSSIMNTPERNGGPRQRLQLFDERTARHLTDHFHAVSQAAKTYGVHELGLPERKITVIERGRDLGRLGAPSNERRRRARAALGIDPNAPVILTVGRHDRQKDHVTLLSAFDLATESHPDALLLVAGREGTATPALLARHERLSHPERVRILGHRDDVPELLAAADLFVLPSLWEGLSGAVLEAMALGLPVVASDIPPMREAVVDGATGLLVPTKQPGALAAAMSSLLSDPELARALGAGGRRAFMERFTVERSAERMRDLYVELLQARGQGAAA